MHVLLSTSLNPLSQAHLNPIGKSIHCWSHPPPTTVKWWPSLVSFSWLPFLECLSLKLSVRHSLMWQSPFGSSCHPPQSFLRLQTFSSDGRTMDKWKKKEKEKFCINSHIEQFFKQEKVTYLLPLLLHSSQLLYAFKIYYWKLQLIGRYWLSYL